MADLKCFNPNCNWEGSYEEGVRFSELELKILKQVLFAGKMYAGKKGYDLLEGWMEYGYMCPECKSMTVIDLHKLVKDGENSNKHFIQIARERVKNPNKH